MPHVFVSYSHADNDFAELLKAKFDATGFDAWLDKEQLKAGEEWRRKIDEAITQSFALIVIMSPDADQSKYVTYEWAYALGLGVHVIPLLLKPTAMHPRLEILQYLDFTNNKHRPWDQLFEQLGNAITQSTASNIPIPRSVPA